MTEKDKTCDNCDYQKSEIMCHLCRYRSHWKADSYAARQLKAQMTMEHRRPATRGNAFQKYRAIHRLSQNNLMRLLNVSSRTVKDLCQGKPPSMKLALRICRKFGIPLIDILITPELKEREGLSKEQVYGNKNP